MRGCTYRVNGRARLLLDAVGERLEVHLVLEKPISGHCNLGPMLRSQVKTYLFQFFPIPRRESISRPITPQAETIGTKRPRRKVNNIILKI
jgi:hypothetical protein